MLWVVIPISDASSWDGVPEDLMLIQHKVKHFAEPNRETTAESMEQWSEVCNKC